MKLNGMSQRTVWRRAHSLGRRMRRYKMQVESMLKAKVIQPSQAHAHSQVHLVAKPGTDKWRFCIDFRALNECLPSFGHPIPNIPQMLARLGSRKAKYYGKIDLTQGYFQAPISASSRKFTAFTCFMGVFEWLRVPMGIKSAGSYFQAGMAFILVGLIYLVMRTVHG